MGTERQEDRSLEIDEYRDAIWSLRMVQEQLVSVQENPWRWKWVLVSVHNALQAFMVLALKGWNDLEVLRAKEKRELTAWMNGEREEYPKLMMDYFLELYTKIQGKQIEAGTGHTRFSPDEEHDREIKRLNGYRNIFIHFLPQAWLATRLEFARMTHYAVDVIQCLVSESGAVRIYKQELEKEAEVLIQQLHEASKQLMDSLALDG